MRNECTAVVSMGGLTFLSLKFRMRKLNPGFVGKLCEFSSRPSGMEFGVGFFPALMCLLFHRQDIESLDKE